MIKDGLNLQRPQFKVKYSEQSKAIPKKKLLI